MKVFIKKTRHKKVILAVLALAMGLSGCTSEVPVRVNGGWLLFASDRRNATHKGISFDCKAASEYSTTPPTLTTSHLPERETGAADAEASPAKWMISDTDVIFGQD
ncbi:MAG: hypothetical protein LBD89_08490 [Tannerellaceae bacterium]|jgi:hypothetical protein|nr:hypothetical protein [Tannerellaceae bacterium]